MGQFVVHRVYGSLWEGICGTICGTVSHKLLVGHLWESSWGTHNNLMVMSKPSKICQVSAHFHAVSCVPNLCISQMLLEIHTVMGGVSGFIFGGTEVMDTSAPKRDHSVITPPQSTVMIDVAATNWLCCVLSFFSFISF